MKNVLSNKKRIKVWGAETKRGTLAVRLVIALSAIPRDLGGFRPDVPVPPFCATRYCLLVSFSFAPKLVHM